MTHSPNPAVRDLGQVYDRLDMIDVLHAYCREADALNAQGMAALFSEDCAANYLGPDESGWIRGRAALCAFLTPLIAMVKTGSHFIANPTFDFINRDDAVLHAYMLSWHFFNEGVEPRQRQRMGRYEARMKRESGVWLIHEFRLFLAGESEGDRGGEHLGRRFPRAAQKAP